MIQHRVLSGIAGRLFRVAGGHHPPQICACKRAQRLAKWVVKGSGHRGREIPLEVGTRICVLAVRVSEMSQPRRHQVVGGDLRSGRLQRAQPDSLEVGALVRRRRRIGERLRVPAQLLSGRPGLATVQGGAQHQPNRLPEPGAVDAVAILGLRQCDHHITSQHPLDRSPHCDGDAIDGRYRQR